ncbi:uncharacterized protein LOC115622605 [Scaptodrosophila lebanonensis]|uniref:Uncharacterized protein LOC115622605 n=1 Tax=Drosophila lebanonensis TaxID=7225 RepID=A0A6J2TBH5_DROLE|nr:uncharacterized protein LOC115622605 [Scaptodrosophila lebanonensis]
MRTSYKRNRPFDFKLIDLVEPNPVLYQRTGLSNYEAMKAKNLIWDKIAQLMGRNVEFCLKRWNNLRYQFKKELRRTEKLCPKLGVVRRSTWPYLERLRFLIDTEPKQKCRVPTNLGEQTEMEATPEATTSAPLEQGVWQTYDGCLVMQVTQTEQPDASTFIDGDDSFIIEEIIEGPGEQMIKEDATYANYREQQQTLQNQPTQIKPQRPASSAVSLEPFLDEIDENVSFLNVDSLLSQLKAVQRERAERRVFAFLLKCQLRSLLNEPIDDLVI